MRAKCINNIKKLPNITLNKKYSVYECEFLYKDGVKQYSCFKIQDDYGSIIPYSAKYFEIISNCTKNYTEKKVDKNKYIVTCNQINYEGFWSQLYDDKGKALAALWKSKKRNL